MARARIAAIAFALCACTALSQQHEMGTLTVNVTDQTGAVIPGARIVASEEAAGSLFKAVAGPNGQALIDLDQGNYDLKVQASGFATHVEKSVALKAGLRP
jgi:Carboxypeptidase regulatory-like domain